MRIQRDFIPTSSAPLSLCWSGDGLIDPVSGGIRHGLDGSSSGPSFPSDSRFDSAVMSPDGRFTVLYEKRGQKGLLLREGQVLRELTRDEYHASTYEYPVALMTFPSGRTILAHCPTEYCRIELEDAETGAPLTRRDNPPQDVFHSRLQFSPDGRYLLSAGWIWHPVDAAFAFDVTRALEQPQSLEQLEHFAPEDDFWEVHAAAFGARDTVVLECSGLEADALHLVVYSLSERRVLSAVPLESVLGNFMVMGEYAVGFYAHPQLVELATGRVVEHWPDLDTGLQGSSIIHHIPHPPPLAVDPAGRRFAVGTARGIEVVRFLED